MSEVFKMRYERRVRVRACGKKLSEGATCVGCRPFVCSEKMTTFDT